MRLLYVWFVTSVSIYATQNYLVKNFVSSVSKNKLPAYITAEKFGFIPTNDYETKGKPKQNVD